MSALVAAIVTLGAAASAQNTPPKDVLKETHGDWEVRCLEGTETCAMSQVGKTEDGKRALLVTIQRVTGPTTQDGKQIPAAMTVQTPLGILIPYGLRIKIDADQVIPLPLSRCIPAGCVSQAPMLDEAVGKMKKGSKAVFGFFLQEEILVNVSLSGFTAAYNSLKPVAAKPQ
jgi:invasion protein IalB